MKNRSRATCAGEILPDRTIWRCTFEDTLGSVNASVRGRKARAAPRAATYRRNWRDSSAPRRATRVHLPRHARIPSPHDSRNRSLHLARIHSRRLGPSAQVWQALMGRRGVPVCFKGRRVLSCGTRGSPGKRARFPPFLGANMPPDSPAPLP